jgi:small subunit ribosomal protein S16
MLSIRFFRIGKKGNPFFRIVVTDKRNSAKGGRFVEILGHYNPRKKEEKELKEERIKYWISVGAKPSVTVHNLLIKEGIIKGEKIKAHAKSKKKTEGKEGEIKTAVEQKEKQPSSSEKAEEAVKEQEKTTEKPTEGKTEERADNNALSPKQEEKNTEKEPTE